VAPASDHAARARRANYEERGRFIRSRLRALACIAELGHLAAKYELFALVVSVALLLLLVFGVVEV
jgi:hypothetical protein